MEVMDKDFSAVVVFEDGSVVVYLTEAAGNTNNGNEGIFHAVELCQGLGFKQRLAFANGVAQVFDHFTGRTWRVGLSGENISINNGRPRRLKNVRFSDIVFVDDVVEEGARLICYFASECGRKSDTLRQPHRHRKVQGPKKRVALVARGELNPAQVRRGAVWAINFLRGVFFPHARPLK